MALVERWSASLSESLGVELPSWKQVAVVVGGYCVLKGTYCLLRSAASCCCKEKEPQLQEKNWKKNVVYLYEFPPFPTIPCGSPFCLKVEAYLKAKKIPHEIRHTTTGRSKYSLLPFIELNGKHFADSQFILFALQEHFGVNEKLSPEQLAVARLMDRAVDIHTCFCLHKFKDPYHFAGLLVSVRTSSKFLAAFLQPLFARIYRKVLGERVRTVIGPFSDAEFKDLLRRDLDALLILLGNKKFFFGDEITYADCTVFAQMASIFYIPVPNYAKDLLRDKNYEPLVNFLERFKKQIWPNNFEQK